MSETKYQFIAEHFKLKICRVLKTLLCTNVLNDVTAAPFMVSFSQLLAVKKGTKKGAAVTSLKTFVRSSAFN